MSVRRELYVYFCAHCTYFCVVRGAPVTDGKSDKSMQINFAGTFCDTLFLMPANSSYVVVVVLME